MVDRVRGLNHTCLAQQTRPANATAYAAGDVLTSSTVTGVVLEFPISKEMNDCGIINHAILVSSANQATKLDSELWLFDTAPTMDVDNAVFTPTDAELLTLVGVIPFLLADWKGGDATVGAGGNAVCEAKNLGLPFNTIGNANVLYGVHVVRNVYTPVSGESFGYRLKSLD